MIWICPKKIACTFIFMLDLGEGSPIQEPKATEIKGEKKENNWTAINPSKVHVDWCQQGTRCARVKQGLLWVCKNWSVYTKLLSSSIGVRNCCTQERFELWVVTGY